MRVSGICGVVQLDGAPVDPQVVRRMLAVGAYRGPGGAAWSAPAPQVALGQLVLAATAEAQDITQPFAVPDRGICVVADARIDNRDELRGLLRDQSWLGPDAADIEFIAAAYRAWG